jgi:integrase/recombinase XerD
LDQPISDKTVWHACRAAATRAGLEKKIHPHTLRHSYATHLLEENVNIRLISAYLGHASLETTLVYAHLTAVNEASGRAAVARILPPRP